MITTVYTLITPYFTLTLSFCRKRIKTFRLTKLWISTQWSCTGAVAFKWGLTKYVCSYYIINKANWLRTQTPFFSVDFFIIQFQPIRGLQYIYSIYYFQKCFISDRRIKLSTWFCSESFFIFYWVHGIMSFPYICTYVKNITMKWRQDICWRDVIICLLFQQGCFMNTNKQRQPPYSCFYIWWVGHVGAAWVFLWKEAFYLDALYTDIIKEKTRDTINSVLQDFTSVFKQWLKTNSDILLWLHLRKTDAGFADE